MTPDAIVASFLPKLTETVLEILSEAPFQGQGTLATADGSQIKFRGEMILTTLLAFQRRILGGKPENRRKIEIEAPKSSTFGDSFSVSVRCEKLPFIKEAAGASRRRFYIALVNMADNSMHLEEISGQEATVEKKFKIMP